MNITKYIEILKILDKLVTHGIAWRDGVGLNRFRLVLITENPKKLKSEIAGEFNKLKGKDKKAHLHIVSKKEMVKRNYEFLEKE
jgi:hypothetical protein